MRDFVSKHPWMTFFIITSSIGAVEYIFGPKPAPQPAPAVQGLGLFKSFRPVGPARPTPLRVFNGRVPAPKMY